MTSHCDRRKATLLSLGEWGLETGRDWVARGALRALHHERLSPYAEPYLAEALRSDFLWVVAEAYDALRLESYGFPALAIESTIALTLDHLHGCHRVVLLQRPGEEATLGGLDVRAELLRLGWSGMLVCVNLPFISLDHAEEGLGTETFGAFIVGLLHDATYEEVAGEPPTPQRHGRPTNRAYRGYQPHRRYGQEVTRG